MPSLIILKGRVLIIRWRNWEKTVAFVKPPPPIHPTLNALSEGTSVEVLLSCNWT